MQTDRQSKAAYVRKSKTMSKIRIMTDSASDISYADEQKYAISVIPFSIISVFKQQLEKSGCCFLYVFLDNTLWGYIIKIPQGGI